VSCCHPLSVYVDEAVRHVMMKQGVLGVKVRIMLPYDPEVSASQREPIPREGWKGKRIFVTNAFFWFRRKRPGKGSLSMGHALVQTGIILII
jgi:hypothetical protein